MGDFSLAVFAFVALAIARQLAKAANRRWRIRTRYRLARLHLRAGLRLVNLYATGRRDWERDLAPLVIGALEQQWRLYEELRR